MLDIYICIISCIILSDLLPDIYFHWLTLETHVTCIILTWHSWTYHVILSCDIEFLWSCDYVTRQYLFRTFHVHYIYVTLCMHGLLAHDLSSWLFLLLLLLSVFDTDKHIVVLILKPYLYCYCIFIFSLLLFFSFVYSCWFASDELY